MSDWLVLPGAILKIANTVLRHAFHYCFESFVSLSHEFMVMIAQDKFSLKSL